MSLTFAQCAARVTTLIKKAATKERDHVVNSEFSPNECVIAGTVVDVNQAVRNYKMNNMDKTSYSATVVGLVEKITCKDLENADYIKGDITYSNSTGRLVINQVTPYRNWTIHPTEKPTDEDKAHMKKASDCVRLPGKHQRPKREPDNKTDIGKKAISRAEYIARAGSFTVEEERTTIDTAVGQFFEFTVFSDFPITLFESFLIVTPFSNPDIYIDPSNGTTRIFPGMSGNLIRTFDPTGEFLQTLFSAETMISKQTQFHPDDIDDADADNSGRWRAMVIYNPLQDTNMKLTHAYVLSPNKIELYENTKSKEKNFLAFRMVYSWVDSEGVVRSSDIDVTESSYANRALDVAQRIVHVTGIKDLDLALDLYTCWRKYIPFAFCTTYKKLDMIHSVRAADGTLNSAVPVKIYLNCWALDMEGFIKRMGIPIPVDLVNPECKPTTPYVIAGMNPRITFLNDTRHSTYDDGTDDFFVVPLFGSPEDADDFIEERHLYISDVGRRDPKAVAYLTDRSVGWHKLIRGRVCLYFSIRKTTHGKRLLEAIDKSDPLGARAAKVKVVM